MKHVNTVVGYGFLYSIATFECEILTQERILHFSLSVTSFVSFKNGNHKLQRDVAFANVNVCRCSFVAYYFLDRKGPEIEIFQRRAVRHCFNSYTRSPLQT